MYLKKESAEENKYRGGQIEREQNLKKGELTFFEPLFPLRHLPIINTGQEKKAKELQSRVR